MKGKIIHQQLNEYEPNTIYFYQNGNNVSMKVSDENKVVKDVSSNITNNTTEIKVPERLTLTHKLIGDKMHEAAANPTTYSEKLLDILKNNHTYTYIPITKNDWVISTKENKGLSAQEKRNDNSVLVSGESDEFNIYTEIEEVASVSTPNIKLPRDRDWILRCAFSLQDNSPSSRQGAVLAGVKQEHSKVVNVGIKSRGGSRVSLLTEDKTTNMNTQMFFYIVNIAGKVSATVIYPTNQGMLVSPDKLLVDLGDAIPTITVTRKGLFVGSMDYVLI